MRVYTFFLSSVSFIIRMTADLRFYIFLSFSKSLVFIYILSNSLTNIYLSDNIVISTRCYLFVCSLWSQCFVSFYISNSRNGKIINNIDFMAFDLLRVMCLCYFSECDTPSYWYSSQWIYRAIFLFSLICITPKKGLQEKRAVMWAIDSD